MSELKNRRFVYGRRQGHRLHPRQARLVDEVLPKIIPANINYLYFATRSLLWSISIVVTLCSKHAQ